MNASTATLETQRLEIQTRFDAERTQAERNRLGQFATPLPLALEITRYVRRLMPTNAGPIHFCDPASGTGAFYSALRAEFHPWEIGSATGIEIDETLARHADKLWGAEGLQVINADFTRLVSTDPVIRRPNLILTNPPYVRHHHLARDEKVAFQQRIFELTGLHVSGLAGLYVYFLIIATEWMEDDGLAAWLIPSEFMDVNYGEAVRRYLTEFVTPIRIHRFDPLEVQFNDALVSSAIVIFRKARPSDSAPVSLSYGGSLESPDFIQDVEIGELNRTRKWSAFPARTTSPPLAIARPGRSNLDNGLGHRECDLAYDREEESGPRFLDFFKIQRGIATGYDDLFIISRDEAQRLGLPDKFLKPILPSPRQLKQVVIESDPDGYPKLDPQLVLIDCQLPEEIVRRQYPDLWVYLADAEGRGARDRYLLGNHEPWYRQEHRNPAPYLCTYMGRGANGKKPFRFIWNKSQAIATNLYLLIYPIGKLSEQLRHRPALYEDVFTFLNQITADDLRSAGRVYGGGLHKMEPGELGQVSARALAARIPELDEAIAEPRLFDRAHCYDPVTTKHSRTKAIPAVAVALKSRAKCKRE